MCIRDRNIGLETLHLRVPRHCENAQKVAEWLSAREDVAWVNYPGLKDNKYHALAEKYMPSGSCGVISFGLKGGREAAGVFMDRLKPVSYTHLDVYKRQLHKGGILLSKDLDDMKLNLHKIQCVLRPGMEAGEIPGLEILKTERRGSLSTITVRGTREEAVSYTHLVEKTAPQKR